MRVGPFSVRLRSPIPGMAPVLLRLYPDFPLTDPAGFVDFDCEMKPRSRITHGKWQKEPQGMFYLDGRPMIQPFPLAWAPAFFEWGLNNSVSRCSHRFLILHAAVAARGEIVAVMPGLSGSGKSTLCAALVLSGWRLLTDELALFDLESGRIAPFCRPVSLKEGSLDVVKSAFPHAVFGNYYEGTHKGLVGHLRPPTESVAAMDDWVTPNRLVFPAYTAGSVPVWEEVSKAQAFMRAAWNGVNYETLGRRGFDLLGDFVDRSDCRVFRFSALHQAVAAFGEGAS